MEPTLTLSDQTLATSGVILLTLVLVQAGGVAVLRMVRGSQPATGLQRAFARAGQGTQASCSCSRSSARSSRTPRRFGGVLEFLARTGIWAAAILMSAGFLLASTGRGVTKPNRLIAVVYVGAVALALGVVSLGVGLLRA